MKLSGKPLEPNKSREKVSEQERQTHGANIEHCTTCESALIKRGKIKKQVDK